MEATEPVGPPLRATYRVQLSPDVDLHAVRDLVPYLRDLGISHVYLSPVLQARQGSTHGYDQVDPTRVSDALGGEAALRALADTGIGIVLDVVPNHMAASDEDPWWADEETRARFFDLDPETGRWRRFFDVDELAALRMEDEEVFATTHGTVLRLVAEGVVHGLRIDHPDGLTDPAGYLARLAAAGVASVWVEKILHPGEALRPWPVEGTVGYEFLDDVTALFVDPSGEAALTALWEEVSGDRRTFAEHAAEAKREQARTTFGPEVERLVRTAAASGLDEAADADVMATALASATVYRTYVEPWSGLVADADREAIGGLELPDRLRRALLLEERGHDELVARFQQTTPAIVAKGVEDTALYRHLRLLALNDVGGDPGRFGLSVDDFHRANAARAERHPRNLLVSSTHDTKRSADVRARLVLLASWPDRWASVVREAASRTADLVVDGVPDGVEQQLVLQTLLGAWPISPDRLEESLRKALREAKRTTSWIDPDEGRERAVVGWAIALLDHRPFLDVFLPFVEDVAEEGLRVSLAQVLLKLTCPGIPDVYQGDELLDLSLVDPDNRRPVDWPRRRRLLDELVAGAEPTPDTAKLWLIRTVLAHRAAHPGPFAGAYRPVDAGPDVCAFTRGDDELLVVVSLRPAPADGAVGGRTVVEVPPGPWVDLLHGGDGPDGGPHPAAELVGPWGIGLFARP